MVVRRQARLLLPGGRRGVDADQGLGRRVVVVARRDVDRAALGVDRRRAAPDRIAGVIGRGHQGLPQQLARLEVEGCHRSPERAAVVAGDDRRQQLLLRRGADVDHAVEDGGRLGDDRRRVVVQLGLPEQVAGVLVDREDHAAAAEGSLVAEHEAVLRDGRGHPGLVVGHARVRGDGPLPVHGATAPVHGVEVPGPVGGVHPLAVHRRGRGHVTPGDQVPPLGEVAHGGGRDLALARLRPGVLPVAAGGRPAVAAGRRHRLAREQERADRSHHGHVPHPPSPCRRHVGSSPEGAGPGVARGPPITVWRRHTAYMARSGGWFPGGDPQRAARPSRALRVSAARRTAATSRSRAAASTSACG